MNSEIPAGYVEATGVCTYNKVRFSDWRAEPSTQEFLEALSRDLEIPVSRLVLTRPDGVYVEPHVFFHVGCWASPAARIWVAEALASNLGVWDAFNRTLGVEG
jgi:hypothetical protein